MLINRTLLLITRTRLRDTVRTRRNEAWSATEGLGPHPTLPRPQKAQTGEGVSGTCEAGEG